jgi:hypothetical protein
VTPKGQLRQGGHLQVDHSVIAAEAYKLPKLLELNPLGSDNIDDPTKVLR